MEKEKLKDLIIVERITSWGRTMKRIYHIEFRALKDNWAEEIFRFWDFKFSCSYSSFIDLTWRYPNFIGFVSTVRSKEKENFLVSCCYLHDVDYVKKRFLIHSKLMKNMTKIFFCNFIFSNLWNFIHFEFFITSKRWRNE